MRLFEEILMLTCYNSAKNKAQQFSFGNLGQWIESMPQGSKILPEIERLKKLGESHSQEAQQLAKDTMGDLQQVFDKRIKQLEDMYNKAQRS